MQTYSTTEARSKFSELVNHVKYTKKIIFIGRNKRADVLMAPIPEESKIPISEINSKSKSFNFLKKEPDLYSLKDIKKKYV